MSSQTRASEDGRTPGLANPTAGESASGGTTVSPPLTLGQGTAEEFARIRHLLEEVGFTTAGVRERKGTTDLDALPTREDALSATEPADALDLLIRLFVDEAPAARSYLDRLWPGDLGPLLEGVGLLHPMPGDPGTVEAPLGLFPTAGLLLVSDHRSVVVAERPPVDTIYPALSSNTVEFLTSLSMTPCQRLLDIGAGTGVAALFGATRYAGQAWAVDITDRATRVAEFNARLNGLDNVTCLTGDVYAPVAGMTFDRIVSHPPYMPDREDPLVFRDGGEDGEQVTRRIIAGLADHLEPGGRFQCRFMATDRKDAPLEERVRAMIGPAEAEFDVALITRVTMQVVPFYGQILASGDLSAAQFEGLVRRFERLDVEHMVIGLLTIDRHATPQRSLTLRRPLAAGAQPDPAAVDWAIRWERSTEDAGFADRLSGMRPHIAPAAELSLTHRMTAGELRAVDCTARTKSPFTFSFSGSPGIALLLGRCDGTLTVSDLRAELVEIGVVPADAPPADFLQLIRNLISGGLLEVAEHPLPAPA